MKGRPFSANDMTLSNVAGCPLSIDTSASEVQPFSASLLIDMSARRNGDHSFSADVHGDEEYLDVGSLESARAFGGADRSLEPRSTARKTSSGMALVAIRSLPSELNVHGHCSHTGQGKN
jgi:hypothetical protein